MNEKNGGLRFTNLILGRLLFYNKVYKINLIVYLYQ